MIEWVNAQELAADHVKAPPSQPVAKDERAGCSPLCGMTYQAFRAQEQLFGKDYPGQCCGSERVYCSPVCRDAKYPPLPAPSPARPAVEVGQRWRFTSTCGTTCDGVGQLVGGKPMVVNSVGEPYTFGPTDPLVGHQWALLAPSQPAETVKSCTCPHGPHTTNGTCPIHVTALIASNGFAGCSCTKTKPATAGKCCQNHPDRKAERFIVDATAYDKSFLFCADCQDAAVKWMAAQSSGAHPLRSNDIPERITAPKLAHQCFDDSTIPEAGR